VRSATATAIADAPSRRSSRSTDEHPVVISQVEPRIVERRRSVEREARRSRRRMWIAVGVVLGLVAAAVGATMSPLLDVDRITVVGQTHVGEQELIDASGVARGDPLRVRRGRDRLMALPWIASARVVRDWPDAVRISVTEERPLATVAGPDAMVLVSHTGRVLDVLTEPARDRPRLEVAAALRLQGEIVGSELAPEVRRALAVFDRIPDDLLLELSLGRVAADGTLGFELPDGTIVHFGPPDDVAAKMLAIQAVLSQVVRDCMATLDVREPKRSAVSRGPGCPGISPEAPAATGTTTTSTGTGSSSGSSGSGSTKGKVEG